MHVLSRRSQLKTRPTGSRLRGCIRMATFHVRCMFAPAGQTSGSEEMHMSGFSPQRRTPWVRSWKAVLCAALFSSSLLQAQVVTQIRDTGPRENRVNVVIVSEGYTAAELTTKFPAEAQRLMDGFLATEPYREFQNYINVFTIAVASAHSGSDHPSRGFFVDTFFNSSFDVDGNRSFLRIPDDIRPNSAQGYRKLEALLRSNVPEYDIVVLSVNDPQYGGSGGGITVVSAHADAPALAIHETAHAFALLGDEFEADSDLYALEWVNVTRETSRNKIKWKHWISPSTPIPTPETSGFAGVIGLFEGANFNRRGWYRPRLSCKMNDIHDSFCEVCAEAITLNIYKRVSLLDRFSPAQRQLLLGEGETLHFNVTTLQPLSRAAAVQWLVDGRAIPGATG
ncbi:MAG TPA: M64 family metallopeptidase, partial [Chthoniobacterales bacterium]